MQPKTRPVVAVTGELDRTLLAYSLVGGAASLLTTTAGGAIIYSGVQNLSLARPASSSSSMSIDLDGSVGDEMSLHWDFAGGLWTSGVAGTGSGELLMDTGASTAVNVTAGSAIDASLVSKPIKYTSGSVATASTYDGADDLASSFSGGPGSGGFMAFRIFADVGSDYRYGWMRFDVPASATAGANFTLVDWAYESDVNVAIAAGATGGAAIPLPGAAALAALALGSGGLREWRRRKRVA